MDEAPPGENRDKHLQVMVAPSESERIRSEARRRGLSVSALVRMAVFAWLDEHEGGR